MKLHLPKSLLIAVLAVVAVPMTHAKTGWGSKDNVNYLYIGGEKGGDGIQTGGIGAVNWNADSYTLTLDKADAIAKGWGDFGIIADIENHPITATVGLLKVESGAVLTLRSNPWHATSSYTFRQLTVECLDVSNRGGVAIKNNLAENTLVINKVSGRLASVANVGTMAIGATNSNTILAGAVLNNGTGAITLNGQFEIAPTFTGATESYSGEDGNGYLLSATYTGIIGGDNITGVSFGESFSLAKNGISLTDYTYDSTTGSFSYTGAANGIYHVNSGTVNIGGIDSSSTGIAVAGGAILDMKGSLKHENKTITLAAGATFANSGTEIDTGKATIGNLVLAGDATVNAISRFGVLASGWGATSLNLNGHVLTKEGADVFHLYETAISNGVINVQEGTLEISGNSTISQGSFFTVDSDATISIANHGTAGKPNAATAGNIILNASGTGTITTAVDTLLSGTAASPTEYGFAGTLKVNAGTLSIGSSATSGTNSQWRVDAADMTIELNGGKLYYFGGASSLGNITVSQNAEYDLLATEGNLVSHKQLSIAAGKTFYQHGDWSNVTSYEVLTGSGNLYLGADRNDRDQNVTIKSISGYTGNITIGQNQDGNNANPSKVYLTIGDNNSNSTISGKITNLGSLTIGAASSTTTLKQSIANSGSVTLNGALVVSMSDGQFTEAGDATYTYYDAEGNQAVNGFRQTSRDYYLVQGGSHTNNLTSFSILGTENDTSTLLGTEGGLVFTAHSHKTAEYYINSGSVKTSENLGSAYVVNVGGTLNIDSSEGASEKLTGTVGAGNIELTVSAGLYNGAQTLGTGKLTISNGAILTQGNADLQDSTDPHVSISSFNSVELDKGTISFQNRQDVYNNLTVTEKGGKLLLIDMANKEGTNLRLAETTTLNGALSLENRWNAQVEIEKLTGNGDLVVNSYYVNANEKHTEKLQLSLASVENYTGTIRVNDIDNIDLAFNNSVVNAVITNAGNDKANLGLSSAGVGSKITLAGAQGYISPGTVNADLTFNNSKDGNQNRAAIEILNGNSSGEVKFSGSISGSGNMVVAPIETGPDNMLFTFSGEVKDWKGKLDIGVKNNTLTFTDDANIVNAAVSVRDTAGETALNFNHTVAATINSDISYVKNGTASLAMSVSNTAVDGTMFNGSVSVSSLEVGQGTRVEFTKGFATESASVAGVLVVGGASISGNNNLPASFDKDMTVSIDAASSSVSISGGSAGVLMSDALLQLEEGASLKLSNVTMSESSSVQGYGVAAPVVMAADGTGNTAITRNSVTLENTTVKLGATVPAVVQATAGNVIAPSVATEIGAQASAKVYTFTSDIFNGVALKATRENALNVELSSVLTDALYGKGYDYVALSFENSTIVSGSENGINVTFEDETLKQLDPSVYLADNTIYIAIDQIPEPTTATLSLLALAALAARRRRRK